MYTDAGKLCVGGKSCSETGVGGMEHMGNLPCDRCTPGMSISDGDNFRVKITKERGGS